MAPGQADQVRHARYARIQKEVGLLEEEMKGIDCERLVKEHIRALNEVRFEIKVEALHIVNIAGAV